MPKRYWLMKSEPEAFSISELERVRVEPWTGVRSFFARLQLRAMSVGDEALFHHSNATPSGVAGLARIVRTGVIDETQFDPASPYFDPKATREKPIWDCVEVEYMATLPHFVSMDRMRGELALSDMMVLKRGMRLSVQPVTEAEYETVIRLGHTPPPPETPSPQPTSKVKAKAKAKANVKAKAKAKVKVKVKAKPTPKAPQRPAKRRTNQRGRS